MAGNPAALYCVVGVSLGLMTTTICLSELLSIDNAVSHGCRGYQLHGHLGKKVHGLNQAQYGPLAMLSIVVTDTALSGVRLQSYPHTDIHFMMQSTLKVGDGDNSSLQ